MSVLYLLVPLAIVLAAVFVLAFAWSVRRGQYDDVHTPALRMLQDDEDVGGDDATSRDQSASSR